MPPEPAAPLPLPAAGAGGAVRAAALLLAVVLGVYALFGLADFGAGLWDLTARGDRAQAVRQAVARGMGPVWEANHVWLIFALVLLFTAFPAAFARLGTALFVPLHLALGGIILRGAAFVFRAHGRQASRAAGPAPDRWGAVFGAGSLVAPFFLGLSLAATAQPGLAWWSPFALLVGLSTVAAGALEAAVYLAAENRGELRRRFLAGAGASLAALALLALPTLAVAATAAPWLGPRLLRGPALPFVLLAAAAALLDARALARALPEAARLWTAALVLLLWAGWATAAWPWLVSGELTAAAAAAPAASLRQVLLLLPWGLLLLVPALGLLFAVFKGRNPAVGPE
ncbi:MAG: cytochrome d ubiquinol oxidase subunit II [Bacillota bacterium]|nr:cytochrome d ubiquinol oxidase subunit II [Bacillota bacterium]